MSAMMAYFMTLLPYNFEPAKLVLIFAPIHVFFPNKMAEAGLANGLSEGLQFVLRAFRHHFDPAIEQIAHRAPHFKSGSHRFHAVAEADALHLAIVKNLHSFAIHNLDRPMWHIRAARGRKITPPPVLTAKIKP